MILFLERLPSKSNSENCLHLHQENREYISHLFTHQVMFGKPIHNFHHTFDRPQSKTDSKHVVRIATKDTEDTLTNHNCSCLINQTVIYINEVKVVNIKLDSVAKFIVWIDLPYKERKFMWLETTGLDTKGQWLDISP